MKLNYNDMLLLAIWEYNRRQDEDLTLELFQETFGQVLGAHFHDKWVHYYNKNLLMMAAYFKGEEKNGQKFCDMVTRQVERYVQNGTAHGQGNGHGYQAVSTGHETFCFDPEDENDREHLREDPYAEYPDFPAECRMKDEAQVEMVYC